MAGVERLKKDIVSFLDDRSDDLASLSDDIFHHPETALNEVRTAALLCGFLRKEGLSVEQGLAGLATAFVGRYGNSGPHIALMAEMDALPALGHACGHNIIGVAAAGAAAALRRFLAPDQLRLSVFGTPAEEQGVGKIEFIRAGLFRGVDFAMMVHPSSKRQVIKGFLGLAKIRFTFYGKAAHAAAYPEEGINALDAVIQVFNSVNALRQQLRQDVRVHGIITEGGAAPNIIPEKAACFFYVRAEDLDVLEEVKRRVVSCAEGAALATGCRLEIAADDRVLAPFKINQRFSALYSAQLRYLGLAEVQVSGDRNRGSSDVGNVSHVVPTIHPHVPIGQGVQIHTEGFATAAVSGQGHAALMEGAKALALTACDLVFSEEWRQEIISEFNKN